MLNAYASFPATETIVDVVANADGYDALIIYSCLAGLEILDAWADTKLCEMYRFGQGLHEFSDPFSVIDWS